MAFRFEKLEVWQKAIGFGEVVYRVTVKFPRDERFGLTNQMRRASVSISSNIAEGVGRSSDREKIRFLEIAYGSTLEVVSQAHLAQRLGFLDGVDFITLEQAADDLTRMLSGLRASLRKRET